MTPAALAAALLIAGVSAAIWNSSDDGAEPSSNGGSAARVETEPLPELPTRTVAATDPAPVAPPPQPAEDAAAPAEDPEPPEPTLEEQLVTQVERLRSESAADRVRAVRWIEGAASPELAPIAVPALVDSMGDESFDVRAVAVRAIGAFREDAAEAVPLLAESLAAPKLRELALRSLEDIGAAAASTAPQLQELARSNEERAPIRRQALRVLLTATPDDEALIPLLEELRQGDNQRLARMAHAALKERGHE
jgi:HEAT repeat protein